MTDDRTGTGLIRAMSESPIDRSLAAPVVSPPEPWRPAGRGVFRTGGLIGVGLAPDPATGRDLLLVASHNGRGLFDTVTGERLARDDDAGAAWPDDEDLTCAGIGPLAGARVRMAGLLGGDLHRVTHGWTVHVAGPGVLLATGDDPSTAQSWWHVFHASVTELRAAGFSPSGNTLVAATTSDVTLWTKADR